METTLEVLPVGGRGRRNPGFYYKTYPVVGQDNAEASLPNSNPLWPTS